MDTDWGIREIITNKLVSFGTKSGGLRTRFYDFFLIRARNQAFDRKFSQGVPFTEYMEQLEEKTATQEYFFEKELEHLRATEYSLKIYGWDGELMNRAPYLDALVELSHGQNPVNISMVIPRDVNARRIKKIRGANVCRIAESPEIGYVIFDDRSVTEWDSTKPSLHLPERDSVIYRLYHTPDDENLLKFMRHFDRVLAEARR